MRSMAYAARLGLSRGLVEFRNQIRSRDELSTNLVLAVAFSLVLFFQRDATAPGTDQSLASVVLPSILGMAAAWGGVMGVSGLLSIEREDGTLLRAKAVPHGMVGYLIGKVITVALMTASTVAVILVAGLVIVPELLDTSLAGWFTVAGVLALGLVATLPWGAIVGSLVKGPHAAFGLSALPLGALAAISGIFYPITALAGWVQAIAQAFPVYWLGHGMRAALLPGSSAAEIGGSWRYLEMCVVLGAWAVAGLLLAPLVLRRMARKESGGSMEARRHAAMQRVG